MAAAVVALGPGPDHPQLSVPAGAVLEADDGHAGAHASTRPLPFYYDLYSFRGSGDSTAVVAAFAVPSGSLNREGVSGGTRYRFDVSLVVADTALRTVYRSDDSVVVHLPRRPPRGHLLTTHVGVQAPPSGTTVQRVIMTDATTPGIGQLYTSSFPIRDYRGSHLMLSDLALSQPDAGFGWKRGPATLALLPTSHFPRSSFDVYYEIYNLPSGNRYSTEISVERIADARGRPVRDDRPVRVRYSGESIADAQGTLAELRYVDASVGIGRYRIMVTVTDEGSGEAVSRSRLFQVSRWAPGATLVPAMPRGMGRP